jgi:quercetin dioxygenase-like cupin family protein
MANFYEEWLETSRRVEAEVMNAPRLSRGRDAVWVETPQDFRVAMLIGRAVGFPTQGGSITKAEIPVGSHTGKHKHGEEAVFILKGKGFVIVDGSRYEFHERTTMHIPYQSAHQFFNTGDEPVIYLSLTAIDQDFDVKLGRVEQLEDKGRNLPNLDTLFPAETSQYAPNGRRIAVHFEDAVDSYAVRAAKGLPPGGHGHVWKLMGGQENFDGTETGFVANSVAITHIFEEKPRTASHLHSHTEAFLYVLQGKGYSEVDGVRAHWEEGDVVHVPPKMTMHDHINPNEDVRTQTLRFECGIRFFYEKLWDGYHKVEHRRHAESLQAHAQPAPVPAHGVGRPGH